LDDSGLMMFGFLAGKHLSLFQMTFKYSPRMTTPSF
jgi:hypothetical protein